jgi:hypothetical protein
LWVHLDRKHKRRSLAEWPEYSQRNTCRFRKFDVAAFATRDSVLVRVKDPDLFRTEHYAALVSGTAVWHCSLHCRCSDWHQQLKLTFIYICSIFPGDKNAIEMLVPGAHM